MSNTAGTGDSYTSYDPGAPEGGVTYILGITFAIILLLVTLSYASYKCRRSMHSSSPPADDDNHHMTFSRGVDDAVLLTFPTFVYSEHVMPNKGDSSPDGNVSGCSICLADYKPTNVIRLLPECGHMFHRKCVDTWLKGHPTCPVCRNSPLPVKLSIQRS